MQSTQFIDTLLEVCLKYKENDQGTFASVWAASSTMVIVAVGSVYDYSQASNAQKQSQAIADAVALNAAIFASNHQTTPSSYDEGLVHQNIYNADQLGYKFRQNIDGGTQNVQIQVTYDAENKEAHSIVWGQSKPSFMQMIGLSTIGFQARSTVKYKDVDLKDPASIFLVMDNSGSMAWDDKKVNSDWTDQPGAQARITGLKSSVQGFMDTLDNLVGPQTTEGERVLRTGMLAYNTNTISSRTVLPKWGTLTTNNINAMGANNGTNSGPSMSTVSSWMETEETTHENEHGKTPLRFAIFMTDGVNTSGGSQWTADSTTDYWRKRYCGRRSCYYQYRNQSYSPGHGWEEGRLDNIADTSTLASCEAMKNDGVKVYTIGYGLEPGYYYENYTYRGERQYEYISQSTTDRAYALLQGCASEPENFIIAEDAERLEEAFETIGKDIAIEIIRIAS